MSTSTDGEGRHPSGERWYAVNSLPNGEARAVINLERQGWRCFCPMMAKTTRSGRRMQTRLRPLFPGYVFVCLDAATSRWRAVDGTFGVRGIVKTGDRPAPLPHGIIEALMSVADATGRVSFAAELHPGDDVAFLEGPFAGLIGKLQQLDAAGRVTVLLDLLGRDTPVRGHAAEVAPVSRS